MQAIRTKYYGPTDFKGSRLIAKCEAGQITMYYDHILDLDQNHKKACELLLEKLGWNKSKSKYYKPMFGGCFAGDYYWVMPDNDLVTEG